jgi:signal transduction histidine kinase
MIDQALLAAVAAEPGRIEELGVAALALDAQHRTLCWNRGFLDLFPEHAGHIHPGEPYAENLRRFYRGRLDAQEIARIELYVAEGVERHHRQAAPFEFLHRNRWLRVAVLPLERGGRLRFWTAAAPPRDGDALAGLIAGSRLRAMEDVLSQTADGLAVRDASGPIVMANQRFAETYGLADARQAIGKSFAEVLDLAWAGAGDGRDSGKRWADNSRFPGAPFELPLPGDRWVRVREQRMHDGRWIGTHVDVTDLCRIQHSLSEARRRAEELATMLNNEIQERKRAEAQMVQAARLLSLGQMATGLAHELNQPLAVMALAADNAILSLREAGEQAIPDALERLESIASNSIRARGVVNHLRLFGRADDGPAPPEPVLIEEAVKGALLLAEAAIRSVGIALHISGPEAPLRVLGQLIPLEQAILNLLLNARDAILGQGRPDGAIRLIVTAEEGMVMLTVSDNGGGFPADILPRAMEPFFTTKEAGKGTGLGLSLAYSTIRAMGGGMTLANAGDGAVVRITLPELR